MSVSSTYLLYKPHYHLFTHPRSSRRTKTFAQHFRNSISSSNHLSKVLPLEAGTKILLPPTSHSHVRRDRPPLSRHIGPLPSSRSSRSIHSEPSWQGRPLRLDLCPHLPFSPPRRFGYYHQYGNANSSGTGASIINSIAVSPLLLAAYGILHEAYDCPKQSFQCATASFFHNDNSSSNHTIRNKDSPLFGIWVQLIVHLVTYGAIGPAATGGTSLTSAHPDPKKAGLLKGAVIIFATVWLLLVALAMYSIRFKRENVQSTNVSFEHSANRTYQFLTWPILLQLLYGLLCAIPFIGIRISYSVITAFVKSKTLNAATGSIVVRIFLQVVPELLAVLCFVVVGLVTHRIYSSSRSRSPAVIEESSGTYLMRNRPKSSGGRRG